jgi:hypothetical protein
MLHADFYVVWHDQNWKIKFKDRRYGPYVTRAAAIRYATDAAHKAGEDGQGAQVLVDGKKKRFRTEWRYGQDPNPLAP